MTDTTDTLQRKEETRKIDGDTTTCTTTTTTDHHVKLLTSTAVTVS